MKLPQRLQLIDGKLSMIDGSSLRKYLRKVQRTWNEAESTVVIHHRDYAQEVQLRADLALIG